MKTPEEWVKQLHLENYCSTGCEEWTKITEDTIEAIQRDALSDTMASTTAQEEFEMTKAQCVKLEMDVEFWKAEVERMRAKWHEARRYLRAANKGAERNSQVMRLQAHDICRLTERIKELEQTNQ